MNEKNKQKMEDRYEEELKKTYPETHYSCADILPTIDQSAFIASTLSFSAGEINLETGEVKLNKDVSEAAKEFWEAVEKAFPHRGA